MSVYGAKCSNIEYSRTARRYKVLGELESNAVGRCAANGIAAVSNAERTKKRAKKSISVVYQEVYQSFCGCDQHVEEVQLNFMRQNRKALYRDF